MNKPVYQITPSCRGCGYCTIICPAKAIRKSAARRYEIDPERCRACGACEQNCPQHAVSRR